MVRRAACVLLIRSPEHALRKNLEELIYYADPGINRLSLYFQRLIRDGDFATQNLSRIKSGNKSDFAFQRSLPHMYALAATEDKGIAREVYRVIKNYPSTKSQKNRWQREMLLERTKWSLL